MTTVLFKCGEDEVRAVADVQSSLDVDAGCYQPIDLVKQRVRIEHDAVADGAPHARVQYAARDLMEHEGAVAEVDRVAGIGTALVADDPIRAFREDINEFPLAFVTPLGTNDDDDV